MNQLRRVKLSCSFLVWIQLAVEGTIKVYSDQFVQVEPWSQRFDTITSNSDFLVYHLSALDMGAFFATIIAFVFFVFSIRLLFRSHVEIFWRLAVFGFTQNFVWFTGVCSLRGGTEYCAAVPSQAVLYPMLKILFSWKNRQVNLRED